MKAKILFFVLGLAFGIMAMWFLVVRPTAKSVANQYVIAVMDQANVALHIRSNRQLALLATIDSALPSYVLELDRSFKDTPGTMDALWMVKAYYERNKISIPPEIQSILTALPPKPPTSCQIRLNALESARTDNSGNTQEEAK